MLFTVQRGTKWLGPGEPGAAVWVVVLQQATAEPEVLPAAVEV